MNPLHRIRKLIHEFTKLPINQASKLTADSKYVDRWVSAVLDLDIALTGKTVSRNSERDNKACVEMLDGDTWEVYLSDGGYSRVYIDVFENDTGYVRLDRQLSLPTVKDNWTRLEREPE